MIIGKVLKLSTSDKKGIPKTNVLQVEFRVEWGIKGDAHAAPGDRQISLLAEESIAKMIAKGLDVSPGSFAENITTRGVNLLGLPVGTQIKLGDSAVLEITRHGKVCHNRCAIYYQAGDCVMPKEGVFARVLVAGTVAEGATIAQL